MLMPPVESFDTGFSMVLTAHSPGMCLPYINVNITSGVLFMGYTLGRVQVFRTCWLSRVYRGLYLEFIGGNQYTEGNSEGVLSILKVS